ncbi:MAG: oxaloacetate decarboxylase [Desulfurococcales archaeon]|jgi:carboxyvinyl-carboxyphosphonate phosphorylmutase|nr:oxaloacetate decarboxylase [Desulfurococcales archaeon]
MKTRSRTFRELLERPGILVVPGVYDALSAKIAEILGFEAVFHTGYGTAASLLALPDVGLVSFSEMRDRVASIAKAIRIPLVADGDTGYGNAVNVYRTVKEYIWAGASGILIEDQVWPKRCGHMLGKEVIPDEEMIGKIGAAIEARNEEDPDFIIVARTDAIAVEGIDRAIERARAYEAAGADVVFIEGFESIEQMRKAVREIKAPMILNIVEGGRTPFLSAEEAEKIGFKIVLFPVTALYAAAKAIYDSLAILRSTGSSRDYLDRMFSFKEFSKIVGVERIEALESRYIPSESLKRKYRLGGVKLVE